MRSPQSLAMLRRVVAAVEAHGRRTERRRRGTVWLIRPDRGRSGAAFPEPDPIGATSDAHARLREIEAAVDVAGPFDPALSVQLDAALVAVAAELLEGPA